MVGLGFEEYVSDPLKLFFYYYYPYKKRQTYATADALKVVFVGVLYNMEQVVVKGIYVD